MVRNYIYAKLGPEIFRLSLKQWRHFLEDWQRSETMPPLPDYARDSFITTYDLDFWELPHDLATALKEAQ